MTKRITDERAYGPPYGKGVMRPGQAPYLPPAGFSGAAFENCVFVNSMRRDFSGAITLFGDDHGSAIEITANRIDFGDQERGGSSLD